MEFDPSDSSASIEPRLLPPSAPHRREDEHSRKVRDGKVHPAVPESNTAMTTAVGERQSIRFRVLRRQPLQDSTMAIKFHIKETFNLFCLSQDGAETPQGVIERHGVELQEQFLNLADFHSPTTARAGVGVLLRSLVLEVGENLEGRLRDVLAEAMHAEACRSAAHGWDGVALEGRLDISTDIVEERAACSACREEFAAGEATARARFALCGHMFHPDCLRYYTEECGVCPSSMCRYPLPVTVALASSVLGSKP